MLTPAEKMALAISEANKDYERCTDHLDHTKEQHIALLRDAWMSGLADGTIRRVVA